MSKETTVRCDRCQKIISGELTPKLNVTCSYFINEPIERVYDNEPIERVYDLCEDCFKSFNHWIRGRWFDGKVNGA